MIPRTQRCAHRNGFARSECCADFNHMFRVSRIDSVDGSVCHHWSIRSWRINIDGVSQIVGLPSVDEPDYDVVSKVIEDTGAQVHSVDQVACGEYIVEDMPTPQD